MCLLTVTGVILFSSGETLLSLTVLYCALQYMEVMFDFRGEPVSGRIQSYLLEKSRVVYQLEGERNFHIFYMLTTGAGAALCEELGLEANKTDYSYMNKVGVVDRGVWRREGADAWR